jgi:hypothetical protein
LSLFLIQANLASLAAQEKVLLEGASERQMRELKSQVSKIEILLE